MVLCEKAEQAELNREFASWAGEASAYDELSDLLEEHPPESIGVLAVHARRQPPGALLATLTRWAVEFPWIQKVAVLDDSPTLPIAKELTRSGFWLVRADGSDGPATSLCRALEVLSAQQAWVVAARNPERVNAKGREPS